jgi:hypothetical protein
VELYSPSKEAVYSLTVALDVSPESHSHSKPSPLTVDFDHSLLLNPNKNFQKYLNKLQELGCNKWLTIILGPSGEESEHGVSFIIGTPQEEQS